MKGFVNKIIFAFAMFAMLTSPIAISANWVENDETLSLRQTVEDLEDRNSQLQRQLNDALRQPRPAQVPNIRLVQPQSLVLSDEAVYVDIIVRNIGRGQAVNALASATTDGPFTVEFLNNTNNIGQLGENSNHTIRARLAPTGAAAAGTYALNLEFAFRSRDATVEGLSSDSISVRIDRQALLPQLSLRDFSSGRERIFPGNGFNIVANLTNLGTASAYNVQVSIADGLDAEGIFLSGGINAPFHQVVEAGHISQVEFALTASERISSGTFPVTFEISGRDSVGEEVSDRFTYFVTVLAAAEATGRASLSLSASGPGGIFSPNQQANVSLTVSNNGTVAARNVRIEANVAEGIVPQSASVQTISILEPGASQQLHFAFSPTAEAASQYHMVGFVVDYSIGVRGAEDETESFSQYVGINVYNPEDEEERQQGSRPRMLVSAYSVNPQLPFAGSEFDLYMTFQNASSTRRVYNIKITLQAMEHAERAGAVFTPVGASNTIFIESLGPRETIDKHLRMFTVPNADPRTYNIEVTFDYEDEDFEEFQEVEQISVSVRQITRLEVSNLQIPAQAPVWNPIFLDFNIINSGRVTLANLRVSLEGNFDTSGIDIFVGNMGRGNSASFSGNFTPIIPGEQAGTLTVSGEDETGELVYYRHDFVLYVEDMMMRDEGDMVHYHDMMMDRDMMFGDESGSGMPNLRMFLIWLAIPVLGAIIVVVILLVRRNKRSKADIFENLQ